MGTRGCGFRLPSALDNRPLNFAEVQDRLPQTLYVSATPGPYELKRCGGTTVQRLRQPILYLGDVVEVIPAYGDYGIRIELFGDEIDAIYQFDPLTGEILQPHPRVPIYPKSHYVMPRAQWDTAVKSIRQELEEHRTRLEKEGLLVEAQRVHQRTMFDLEMIKTVGYCRGVENYSRHLTGRLPGEAPPTLMDYLPSDAMVFIDESHVTVPQLRGMYEGDRSRKLNLVKYGFRLPSALDNRPLNFAEVQARLPQTLYVSATPGPYELKRCGGTTVQQVIRPTGLMDPPIEVRPVKGQIEDLLEEIRQRAEQKERVLVTTLTKRMSEELSEYYTELEASRERFSSHIHEFPSILNLTT